jgi:hypothetical protein
MEAGVALLFHPDFDYSKDAVGGLERLLEANGISLPSVWSQAAKEAWEAVDAVSILRLEELFAALEWDQVEPYILSYESVRLQVFQEMLEKFQAPPFVNSRMVPMAEMLATTRSLQKYETEFQAQIRNKGVVTQENLISYAYFLELLCLQVKESKIAVQTFENYQKTINEKFFGWLDQHLPRIMTDRAQSNALYDSVIGADRLVQDHHVPELAVYTAAAVKKFAEQLPLAIQKILDDKDPQQARNAWASLSNGKLAIPSEIASETLDEVVGDRVHQNNGASRL